MHDFENALIAAENSLNFRNGIYDHRKCIASGVFTRSKMEENEDLFYTFADLTLHAFTPEMEARFEKGTIMLQYYENIPYGQMVYGIPCNLWMPTGTDYSTSGLTTIDMWLTKAECLIRKGDNASLESAMAIINNIRENRIIPDVYEPLDVTDSDDLFAVLKNMYRCENWFTYKNFLDMKRWNTEDKYKETLTRNILGVEYKLEPESTLWIFPFPQNATAYNENLIQNY